MKIKYLQQYQVSIGRHRRRRRFLFVTFYSPLDNRRECYFGKILEKLSSFFEPRLTIVRLCILTEVNKCLLQFDTNAESTESI